VLIVGGNVGYANTRIDAGLGAMGRVDIRSMGLYATWLQYEGFYVDGQALHFDSTAGARMSDGVGASGSTSFYGAGMTLEAGRHIQISGFGFIEAYVQLAGFTANSSQVVLNNGMDVRDGKIASV
jgi:outer membrane autotransporter protein